MHFIYNKFAAIYSFFVMRIQPLRSSYLIRLRVKYMHITGKNIKSCQLFILRY